MTKIDARRVVSFESEDKLFKIVVMKCAPEDGVSYPAHDITCEFNGAPMGSVFIDRPQDLVMLADALNDFIEARNLREKVKNNTRQSS